MKLLIFKNKLRQILFILICFGFSYSAYSQIKVKDKSVNFGFVEDWKSPEAVYQVTNTGTSKFTFLPTFTSRDLSISFPKGYLEPGQSAEIKIKYYTGETGPFYKKIPIYISSSNKPIYLTMAGNIRSIAWDAYTNCPDEQPSGRPINKEKFPLQIRVVDDETHIPIHQATVDLYGNNNKIWLPPTPKNGMVRVKIPNGLYNLKVEKEGYFPIEKKRQYLNEKTNLLVIALIKDTTKKEELIAARNEDSLFTLQSRNTSIISNRIDSLEFIRKLPDFDATGELSTEKYKPNNVVFLIDISFSMKNPTKLPLLKNSIKELINVLRDIDKVTIITYASETNVLVPTTSASNKEFINSMIDQLQAGGISRGTNAMQTAYKKLEENMLFLGNNQLVLASDGLFTDMAVKEKEVYKLVKDKAQNNIKISIIGFGKETKGDKFMKNIANYGKGSYLKITHETDVEKLLIEEIQSQSIKF